jgi:hypothetical protein
MFTARGDSGPRMSAVHAACGSGNVVRNSMYFSSGASEPIFNNAVSPIPLKV